MIDEPKNGDSPESTTARVNRSGSVWIAALSVGVVLAVYHVLVRPWHRTWGATSEEVARQLPGDVVPEPSDETTRAVTVVAPSDDVWSWVV